MVAVLPRRTMSSAELVDEPDAIGELTGGDVVGTVNRSSCDGSRSRHRSTASTAETRQKTQCHNKTWTVVAVDEEHGTIDLKIGKATTAPVAGGHRRGRSGQHEKAGGPFARYWPERVVRSGFGVADAAHRPYCSDVGQMPASPKGVRYVTTESQPAKPPIGSSSG